jgi:hypothetical protein
MSQALPLSLPQLDGLFALFAEPMQVAASLRAFQWLQAMEKVAHWHSGPSILGALACQLPEGIAINSFSQILMKILSIEVRKGKRSNLVWFDFVCFRFDFLLIFFRLFVIGGIIGTNFHFLDGGFICKLFPLLLVVRLNYK